MTVAAGMATVPGGAQAAPRTGAQAARFAAAWAQASSATAPSHAYRAQDYADGRAMSILPPGENGLVNATDALQFETTKTRPPASDDQLAKYAALLHDYPGVTDKTLSRFYDDESFGVRPGDVVRTETPETGVTIYRDTHDVPHVYAPNDASLAFGAGYAQAEDRLFLMDVLRHYGEGTLASFLGGSCEFEQMDHDQLLLSPYTAQQAVAQVDALPREYGAPGALAKTMIEQYVAGVNAYIAAAKSDPSKLPADYSAAGVNGVPQNWGVQDVVAVAGLIGGIFGKGGGSEVANAHLLQYLRGRYGVRAGTRAFRQFRTANDPLAATTVVDKRFPYEIPGRIDHSLTALPDRGKPLTGGPVATSQGCNLQTPNPTGLAIVKALQAMPKHMSNALVVAAQRATGGHPVAVFGPQVSYYAPQILALEDLHSPDYAAEGASFPGTGIVELGRGEDFAWSATSAGSDLIDQRIEKICNPSGGAPAAQGTSYLFRGRCVPMRTEDFTETALPTPAAPSAPAQLDHVIHLTRHGIVQGWTTVHGAPVAVVNQRSTFNHDVDSVIGFLEWARPSQTHDVQSWMRHAGQILYTFNWFYADNRDIGYYVSGKDPIRARGVDPDLPTWGTGGAEWHGYLSFTDHVHEINPKQGFFISWNNKPAPGFAAADDQYGYGQVYRSVMLVRQLRRQFALHGRVDRADVVKAMAIAASQDLDGLTVLPLLLRYVERSVPHQSAGVRAMLTQLRTWIAAGAHRITRHAGDAQYEHAAAVAIADELVPRLVRALYDPILAAGGVAGVGSTGGAATDGYTVLPMQWVNTPNSGGAHLGSAYDGGYESYLVATLEQLLGRHPVDGFGREITRHECRGGPATCAAAIAAALQGTYRALVAANGSSTVSSWTASSASKAAGVNMPVYDEIEFKALGLVGQPAIEWQNRPTFQQVVQFLRHRRR